MVVRNLVILLLAGVLSGCADAPPAPPPPTDGTDPLLQGDRDLRTHLLANDTLEAPQWQVGDVFEQHMYFGRDDTEGRHIKTVVVSAGAGGYEIATPDEAAARFESVYDYPVLGRVGPKLEATAFGSDWSWMYDFPLTDGKTWSGTMEEMINWNSYSFTDFTLSLRAIYDARIPTPMGERPGFWIEGMTSNGSLLMRYNYVPAVGWFSHLWIYDLETAQDDVVFHAMSMGTSRNYTGPYLVAEATTLIDRWFGVFPDPGGPVDGDPPVPQEFQVPADARLMGVAVPVAVGGRSEVHIVDPGNTDRAYAYQQTGMEGPGFDVHFIDLAGQDGDWHWGVAHAGIASGSYTWLSRVTTTQSDLG